jgi:hypothetical protein
VQFCTSRRSRTFPRALRPDSAGTVRAVDIGARDLGQLERAVVESPLPAGAAMMLVDRNGVFLSHHAHPER